MVRFRLSGSGAAGLALLLASCIQNPETATVANQPHTAPVKNISSFTQALSCMDDVMWAQGKRDVFLTSAGIPDATGKITAGTKEMLISAISRMSAKSNAFRFVDFDPTQVDVQALSELIGIQPDFTVPSYYIRGAITQLDDNVLGSLEGAGISLPFAQLGLSRDQVVSVISVDLNVGQLVSRQILPGLSANNSIAVVRKGVGGDAGGRIGKAGLSFNVSLNTAEGSHQAVRTLIELSVIELLGKLTRTPYWQCLEADETNPLFKGQAREWFDTMTQDQRVQYARSILTSAGYLQPQQAVAREEDLRDAIARYQSDNRLIPSGRMDFDLYYNLLGASGRLSGQPGRVAASAANPTPLPTAPPEQPLAVFLSTDRGPQPSYKPGEVLRLTAQTTRDSYMYCFYQDGNGRIARIFPNRFQPDALVPAHRQVEIPPGQEKPFNIRFDRQGTEERIACFVSAEEVGLRLPDPLKAEDLAPLPVHNLDEVAQAFTSGGKVTRKVLAIKVVP